MKNTDRRRPVLALFALLACACGGSPAAPVQEGPVAAGDDAMALPLEEEVTYSADGVELRGFLARPAGAAEARPSVLVVHEWWGHNDYARRRARELADLGYVALAVDMYGEGKSASHPEDAGAFMQALLKDRPTMVARFDAGLALLRSQPDVDGDSVAAIGYCMGGGVVLDMAREGRDLDAVVSFHGLLSTGLQAEPGAVQAGILVLTGADDPMAGQAERDAFVAEMDAAGVDGYGMVVYPGVRHAFTNADATRLGEEFGLEQALRYDAGADADSWQRMKDFLQMSFAAE